MLFTNVVTLKLPFQYTVDVPPMKLVPFTVRINPLPLATPLAGLTDVVVGVAGFSVYAWPFDGVTFPVFSTVTVAVVPPLEIALSLAVIAAVSCVEFTNVVVLFEPFHLTVLTPLIKFVPFTVKVKPLPLAVPLVGLILEVVGATGFKVYV